MFGAALVNWIVAAPILVSATKSPVTAEGCRPASRSAIDTGRSTMRTVSTIGLAAIAWRRCRSRVRKPSV